MLALLNKTSRSRLLWAAGVVALLTLATAPVALAQDDEEETFEQSIIRQLLGGGSKPGIEYRERSPLVIPPSRDLPAPESATTVAGAPSWPRDPDQRKQAATRSGPVIDSERATARHLRPDEMRRGTLAKGAQDTKPAYTASDNEQGRALRPAEYGETRQLFNFFASKPPEAEAFKGEPPRTRMTEPPAGYRTPAPTQPYQAPKEAGSWFKPFNLFDRGLANNN